MSSFEILVLIVGMLGIILGYVRPDILPVPVLWGFTLILFFVLRHRF